MEGGGGLSEKTQKGQGWLIVNLHPILVGLQFHLAVTTSTSILAFTTSVSTIVSLAVNTRFNARP